jgi:hypothetical protein
VPGGMVRKREEDCTTTTPDDDMEYTPVNNCC